jgi:4,5-DOPA dioxygenase extradiol
MKMPVLFVGHGSPMNAIEDNEFTRAWRALGQEIPRPRAILAISAHWYTADTRVNTDEAPRQIYDMYGFPDKLYRKKYETHGAPEVAEQVRALLPEARIDNGWGIDHGTWSVLCHMYPDADIPVTQLSIDYNLPAEAHYRVGRSLAPLRESGVLILGSGNVVHDLRRVSWDMEGGFPWAEDFDEYIHDRVLSDRPDDVVHFERAGRSAREAFPTPDHYYPLLYALGAREPGEGAQAFCKKRVLGSVSMTGYRLG